jgi:ligand-binding sensor domain-containing protein
MFKQLIISLVLLSFCVFLSAELIPVAGYTAPYRVYDLYESGDNLWVATWGGLVKVDLSTGEREIYNTSNSGLISNHVYAVTEDAEGNLLVGTVLNVIDEECGNHGVSGFHKLNISGEWEVYSIENSELPSPSVSTIACDEEGNYYVGTLGGGVVRIDVAGDWTIFDRSNSDLPSNSVRRIWLDSEDTVWLGCITETIGNSYISGGLSYFNGEAIVDLSGELPNANQELDIYDFAETEEGMILIAALYSDYYTYDGEEFIHYEVPEIEPGGYSGAAVRCLVARGDGTLLFGTSAGVAVKSGDSWALYNNFNSILGEYNMSAMAVSANDDVWLGSSFWGVHRLAGTTFTEWSILSEEHTVQSMLVSDIACTPDGSVWICAGDNMTNNGIGGLSYLRDGHWGLVNYDNTTDFLYNDLYTIENTVYCATGNEYDIGGVIYGDESGWTRYDFYNTEGGFPYSNADFVTVDGTGMIWAIRNDTNGGVCVFDGVTFEELNAGNSGLLTNSNYCIESDPNEAGTVWIGGSAGLQRVRHQGWLDFTFENFHPGNTPLTSATIIDLCFDSGGTLWVATDNGVTSYDGSEWWNWNEYMPNFMGSAAAVWDIYSDGHDRIWCATYSGIVCLQNGAGEIYTSQEIGLPTLAIDELAVDSNDRLWIGTYCSGVYCYEISMTSHNDNMVITNSGLQHSNYPNPFNPSTTISFSLAEASEVEVSVYDIRGRKVIELMNGYQSGGNYNLRWDGTDIGDKAVASGIYFYMIRIGQERASGKMILMK